MPYVLAALLGLIASVAHAEPPTAAPAVPAAHLADEPSRALVQPIAIAEWPARRRARLLLAAAIGIAVSAPLHVAWAAPTRTCGYDYERNASLYAAGAVGGAGIGLTIGSGMLLARSRRRAYLPATSNERIDAALVAAGAALAVQAILGVVRVMQLPGCST